MKANVLHKIGDLRYEEVPVPDCLPDWALVRVEAAGICSSDVARILTKGTYHFPTIPGHEFSGVVIDVGDPRDAVWLGKRVGVYPLIPCRKCRQCEREHYETCAHYDYIGSRRDGAFAEVVAAPVWNLIELPDCVSFEAGAMLEPLCVGLHAVKRAGELTGRETAVIGTGIIGIAAAFWAHVQGAAQVYVIGRGEAKRALVEHFPGLHYCSDRSEMPDLGMNVVIEAVGTAEALASAVRLAAPDGHVVLVGNPAGRMTLPQDLYWQILRKQLVLFGSWNSSYRSGKPSDWTEALETLSRGLFSAEGLVTHRIAPCQLQEAVRFMAAHQRPYCKIMMTANGEKIRT